MTIVVKVKSDSMIAGTLRKMY